jgi:hypothetical protein
VLCGVRVCVCARIVSACRHVELCWCTFIHVYSLKHRALCESDASPCFPLYHTHTSKAGIFVTVFGFQLFHDHIVFLPNLICSQLLFIASCTIHLPPPPHTVLLSQYPLFLTSIILCKNMPLIDYFCQACPCPRFWALSGLNLENCSKIRHGF